MPSANLVAYVYHEDFTARSDEFIPTKNRNDMVHCLIDAYGLLDKMTVVNGKLANREDLEAFHSQDYLKCLENASDDLDVTPSGDEDFGLGYDCPKNDGIMDYCYHVAGGTIEAAKLLSSGTCQIAIHWFGGWHHAKRSSASGYCYVNDCVLGIIELRKKYPKVLYVDIDLHHGDGVEDAFCGTNRVVTLSFHKFEPGFFPGSGSVTDVGFGKGKYFAINVPLLDGITDSNYCSTFDKIFQRVVEKYQPDAIFCQCGADGLNEDPMSSFSLTQKSHVHCVNQILKAGLPTLITGGGGYNPANTARCWTSITAAVLGVEISEDIPEHDYFPEYGPHFELGIPQGLRKDLNTPEYLGDVVKNVLKNVENMT